MSATSQRWTSRSLWGGIPSEGPPVAGQSVAIAGDEFSDIAIGYPQYVAEHGFTEYFEQRVLVKRPYVTKELCVRVVEAPIRVERQEANRYRFWGEVPELAGRFLRLVTLDDKVTIHNAFLDRRFKP